MFEKKTFVLNCEVCDTRKMTAESLQNYEQIVINAELVLVNEKSRAILNALPMVMNTQNILETDEDVEVVTVNGNYEINGDTAVERSSVLCVNGSLRIAPGTENVLKKFKAMIVNGNIRCPQSMMPYLAQMHVNGYTVSIPEDCIELDSAFTLDRYFLLRARKGGQYYADEKVILIDPQIDAEKLMAKELRFLTKKLITAEKYVEEACTLIDETVKLTVIPEGWSYVSDSAELNEALLQKYGTSLWIDGDLTLYAASTPLLPQIQNLHVEGTVELMQEQTEAFGKLNAEYGDMRIIKGGRIIKNGTFVTVDEKALLKDPNGLTVRNCAVLTIAKELDPELIMEKLCVRNAGVVFCTPEQRGAVSVVCRHAGVTIQDHSVDPMEIAKNLLSTKVINAEQYIL